MMRNARTRPPGTRWHRCVRWLGWDQNPLRRTADRLEAACRLAVLILFLTAVPVTAVLAGRVADHLGLRQVQAQQASDHQVSAILTQAASGTGTPDPYSNDQTTWVSARWSAPGGSPRSGLILAPAGAAKGSTVRTWINASGAVTDPPATHRDVLADVAIAVTVDVFLLTFTLLGAGRLACRRLDRQRLTAWDDEWRAIGPLWTGHRS